MPRFIVKIHDYYLEWSTIVDAPVTFGMSLDEFKDYYARRYGEEGMRELPERLARVEARGTSSFGPVGEASTEYVTAGNRAGENEAELTLDELYRAYCLREPIRKGWRAK